MVATEGPILICSIRRPDSDIHHLASQVFLLVMIGLELIDISQK
jgi:hypothetical protein